MTPSTFRSTVKFVFCALLAYLIPRCFGADKLLSVIGTTSSIVIFFILAIADRIPQTAEAAKALIDYLVEKLCTSFLAIHSTAQQVRRWRRRHRTGWRVAVGIMWALTFAAIGIMVRIHIELAAALADRKAAWRSAAEYIAESSLDDSSEGDARAVCSAIKKSELSILGTDELLRSIRDALVTLFPSLAESKDGDANQPSPQALPDRCGLAAHGLHTANGRADYFHHILLLFQSRLLLRGSQNGVNAPDLLELLETTKQITYDYENTENIAILAACTDDQIRWPIQASSLVTCAAYHKLVGQNLVFGHAADGEVGPRTAVALEINSASHLLALADDIARKHELSETQGRIVNNQTDILLLIAALLKPSTAKVELKPSDLTPESRALVCAATSKADLEACLVKAEDSQRRAILLRHSPALLFTMAQLYAVHASISKSPPPAEGRLVASDKVFDLLSNGIDYLFVAIEGGYDEREIMDEERLSIYSLKAYSSMDDRIRDRFEKIRARVGK